MVVRSIKEVCELINNLLDASDCVFTARQIDYCFELAVGDYTIYFEDLPYEREKFLEICYKLHDHYYIQLNRLETTLFRLLFKSLVMNYLSYIRLSDKKNLL